MFVNNLFVPVIEPKVKEAYWNTYVNVIDVVKDNIHIFNSFYHAGCGYDNFSSLFRNLAFKMLGINNSDELNWSGFDDAWFELFDEDEFAYLISFKLHFKFKDLTNEYKILTDLLNTLCQRPQLK